MTNDASLPEADHAGGDESQQGPVVASTLDSGTAPGATHSPCVQERPRAN